MRRSLKIFAWSLGVLLLLAALLGVALYVAGNTRSGRTMIERTIFRLSDGQVKLTTLKGSFFKALSIDRLELRDMRGVWLMAERVEVRWSPLALLARRVQIDNLRVARLRLQRFPEGKSPRTGTGSIPRIDAGNVAIEFLELAPELAGAPTTLTLHGSAHLRSLEDMLIEATAKRINGDGQYELHVRFDPERMDAGLALHEPAGGPLENLVKLPGLGPLAATLTLNGPRAAERLDLSLDAGPIKVRAQGLVNVEHLAADLDFEVRSPALSPRPDLSWERATLKGRWHGDLKTPTADGHLEIAALRVPGDIRAALATADFSAQRGQAVLRARIEALRIAGPAPQVLQDSPLIIDASMQLDNSSRPVQLLATHRLFILKGQGETSGSADGVRNATVDLRLRNLQALAAIMGQNLRGTAVVTAQVREQAKITRFALDAGAELVGSAAAALIGQRPTLKVSGNVTDTTLKLENLKLSAVAGSLAARGEAIRASNAIPWASSRLRLRWDGNIADLANLSPILAGSARGSGTFEGPANDLSGAAQIDSTLAVHGSPMGALSAEVAMRGLLSAPSGSLVVHGNLDNAPLLLDVSLERAQDNKVRALVRRATWKSAHLSGDMNYAAANAQAHGQLRLQIDRLNDVSDLLGTVVGGSLAGTVEFNPARGRTHTQFRVAAHDLSAAGVTGEVLATGEGFADALRLTLVAHSANVGGAAASLTAAGSLNLDGRMLRVAEGVASFRGVDTHLLSPATVTFAEGLSIDRLKLGAQRAVLEVSGEISPALELSANLRDVQPSLVNAFVPELLESGTIGAKAHLQGTWSAPQGEVRLRAVDLRMANDAVFGLPALDVRVAAHLMGNAADIDARLSAGGASKLTLLGRAPLRQGGAWDLKIQGAIDAGLINPLLEGRGQRAGGQLTVEASVGGNFSAPDIVGTVKLAQGSLRDYGRGISITDIEADIAGSGGGLQIQSFTAKAAPGTLSMTGNIGVLQAGMPVDLKLEAVNAQPISSKLVTANLDGDLHVTGQLRQRINIRGTVHLNRTLIGIPNRFPPNVAVLDVRRRGKTAAPDRGTPLVIGLDVAIQAPREILVEGRGLDAEVGGELHLSGTTAAPAVSGGFDLQRGSYSLAGKKLDFIAGRVGFDGTGLKNDIAPTLDFTAQTVLSDVTASVHITGVADAPQFEFLSTPSLPQDEILARLLFGVRVEQLSALQLAQIGAGLASLSGLGGDGSLNPLVKLQKRLGLDRLSLGSAPITGAGIDASGASIEAGRYISKRVYVEAKQSTTGFTQLQGDIELTRRLKLQTRLGNGTGTVQGTTPENDPGSSIGLTYQFEY